MLISIKDLVKKYSGKDTLKGIVHLGAGKGEEFQEYRQLKPEKVIFVEANPFLISDLELAVGYTDKVIVSNLAITDESFKKINFNLIYSDDLTNFGCSSIFTLAKHSDYYPMIKKRGEITVNTITIDDLIRLKGQEFSSFELLNMDLQGAELLALKGGQELLKHLNFIYTEISTEMLYSGTATVDKIDEFLKPFGFERAETFMVHKSWGDAFYIKKNEE